MTSIMFIVALVLSVLISPAVEAACAWVMWLEMQTLVRGDESKWTLLDPYSTQSECERSARDLAENSRNEFQKTASPTLQISGKGPTVAITMTEPGRPPVIQVFTHKCYPDTIDPRPRGK